MLSETSPESGNVRPVFKKLSYDVLRMCNLLAVGVEVLRGETRPRRILLKCWAQIYWNVIDFEPNNGNFGRLHKFDLAYCVTVEVGGCMRIELQISMDRLENYDCSGITIGLKANGKLCLRSPVHFANCTDTQVQVTVLRGALSGETAEWCERVNRNSFRLQLIRDAVWH